MSSCTLKVVSLYPGSKLPTYGSGYAAGMDLYAYIPNEDGILILEAGQRALVSAGIKVQLNTEGNPNYYLRIAPRSGLAVKGIDVGAGVVDYDYRGEVKVLLINNSGNLFMIKTGDRIAQMIVEQIRRVNVLGVETLEETQRGEGGFGSTGLV